MDLDQIDCKKYRCKSKAKTIANEISDPKRPAGLSIT